jgi:hypothetical protein
MGIQSLSWRQDPRVEWDGDTSYGGNLARIIVTKEGDNEEYMIGNDYQCQQAALLNVGDCFDEGLFNNSFLMQHVGSRAFAQDWVDSEEDYYYESVKESPSSYIRDDPEGEDDEYTEDQIDNAVTEYKRRMKEEISGDPFRFLTREMGLTPEEATERLKHYINKDELLKDAINSDGRGHFLNSYDGVEYSLGDLDLVWGNFPDDLISFLGIENLKKDEIYLYRD